MKERIVYRGVSAHKIMCARYTSELFVIVAAIFVVVFLGAGQMVSAEESGCVSCHTSVKELVRITKEIAAKNPQQKKSAESEGEG